jgi:hypothetical protein
MELWFQASNLLVMPFWALMILLPHWQWSKRIVQSPWIVAPVAALYVILVLPGIAGLAGMLASPSLATIASLLGTPEGATIAWAHFLAFDLFVGRWVYLESRRIPVSAWIASPVLLLVFLFGPMGLLLFLGVRTALGGNKTGELRANEAI